MNLTREERLAAFGELAKVPGIQKGSVFADEQRDTALLLFDHPAGCTWNVLGPDSTPGFWRLESSVPVGLDYFQERMDYRRFHLCVHETEFQRVQ